MSDVITDTTEVVVIYGRGDSRVSSHREMIDEKINILLDEIPIELPGDWGRYVDEPLTSKEIEKVRQSVIRQSPYGNSEWQMKVCKELGLESTLNPKGRPRKEKRA